jgi:hypothetical protein
MSKVVEWVKGHKVVSGVIAVVVVIALFMSFANRMTPEEKFLTQSNMSMKLTVKVNTYLFGTQSSSDATTIAKMTPAEAKKAYDEKSKTLTIQGEEIDDIALSGTRMTGTADVDGQKVAVTITQK